MILSDADHERVFRGLMRFWSREEESIAALVKSDLLDAVTATDDWIDQNQGAFNLALPLTARSNLTASQKTLLFVALALMRHDPGFLRRLVGELD